MLTRFLYIGNNIEEFCIITREMPVFYLSPHQKHQGFTLIEMAVVLTIITLVVGGITVASDLLDKSKIRSIPIHAYEYSTAIIKFQTKYSALPGDMATATSTWGARDGADGLGSDCTDVASVDLLTCNGDGDGTIGRGAAEYYETFRAWQHLKNADMVKGVYTGAAGGAGTQQAIPGQNIPEGDLKDTGYDIMYFEEGAAPAANFTGISYNHVIHFGKEVSGNNFAHGAAISAQEAFEVDTKVDDGTPGTGMLTVFTNATHSDCASTDDPTTAIYLKANTSGEHCAFTFITGF